jgi:hypothetical protein
MLPKIWKRKWAVLALVLLWLVFEWWISWSAFCKQTKPIGSIFQSAEEANCIFKGPVSSFARLTYNWWQHTFDDADSYIALFTGILAISTILLWVVTKSAADAAKRAADAAKESADASVAVEAARVLIYPDSHNYWSAAGQFAAQFPNSPEMGTTSTNVTVRYFFRNYGKTLATLKEIRVQLEISANPPERSIDTTALGKLPTELVIEAAESTVDLTCRYGPFLSVADAIAINSGETSFWLTGHVIYDDVFGREGTQRFLYKLRPEKGFIRYFDQTTFRKA